MAELLSTEFVHHAISSARRARQHSNSCFRHIQPSLANCSQKVSGSADKQQCAKRNAEQQLSSEQLAHKIDLQEEENSEYDQRSLAQFRLRSNPGCKCVKPIQDDFH